MASRGEIWKQFTLISLITFIASIDAQITHQPSICTFVLLFIVLQSDAVMFEEDWIVGNTLLPRAFNDAAVGLWNNSIFILGGYGAASKQFVEYNIWKDIIIDHGADYFNEEIYGFGQFFQQQRNELYTISINGESLSIIDLSTTTKHIQSNWNQVTITYNVGIYACLVSNDEYLFIIGGYSNNDGSVLDQLQILTVSSLEWLSNPPSLNNARRAATCAIHETSGFLYVAGGFPLDEGKAIEKIRMANILSNSWQLITSQLVYAAAGARAILYDSDYILVIGGWNAFNPHAVNEYIQIIDTNTDTVSLSSSTLNFPAAAASVIIVENTIYKFGGSISAATFTNKWESYDITTDSPSQSPLEATTNLPSFQPSLTPSSLFPSAAPTSLPSINPSLAPTKLTLKPSKSPSKFPSFSQSQSYLSSLIPSSSITLSEERNTNKTKPTINEDESTSKPKPSPNIDGRTLLIIEICVVVGLILIIIILTIIGYKHFKSKPPQEKELTANVKQAKNINQTDVNLPARNSIHLQKVNSMSTAFVHEQNVGETPGFEEGDNVPESTKGNDNGVNLEEGEFEVIGDDDDDTNTNTQK